MDVCEVLAVWAVRRSKRISLGRRVSERIDFAEAGFDGTTAHLIRLPAAGFEDISLCRPSKAFRRGCFPA
jgi:hypothetical protein